MAPGAGGFMGPEAKDGGGNIFWESEIALRGAHRGSVAMTGLDYCEEGGGRPFGNVKVFSCEGFGSLIDRTG